MTIAVFCDPDGRIRRRCRGDAEHLALWQSQGAILAEEGVSGATHYWDGAAFRVRPRIAAPSPHAVADGDDAFHLEGLPPGSVVAVEGLYEDVVEDGTYAFATTMPGVYRIRVTEAFPYLDAEWEVTFHAPGA